MTTPRIAEARHIEAANKLLGTEAGGPFTRRWLLLAGAALLLVMGVGLYLLLSGSDSKAPRYETETIARGRLEVSVSATGKLQPTNQVDVGSELSGIIDKVLVDINDRVKKGQELARLDTARLNDQIARSRAALVAAEAGVRQSEATLTEARANLRRLQEVHKLSGGKVPSRAEMENAEAQLARAEAGLASAKASVSQALATLSSDETNLSKASIRSPINGVVLARKVEPGQTVAASLQTPVLFTLAEDLSEMELEVDVDEADVGQVREGQQATFNVDAYPGRKYPATISRVSYGSRVSEGVVSYPAVLKVSNEDLSLRPGMTATAEISTAVRENALLVPNAALRYTPAANSAKASSAGGILSSLLPRMPRTTGTRTPRNGEKGNGGKRVWILKDGQPVAIRIKTGLTNGRMTEVLEGDLKPGMAVITDSVTPAK
ncbi:MAG: efflux RND transporter periplasmic adaptor subunit [Pseudomonadota bacterium]